MNTKIVLFVLFLSIISIIAAQDNHMDIMTTMTGDHDYAQMGFIMTTLDWNGDGHDDLAISENSWRPPEYETDPNVRPYGKLLFYFGGTNFDNTPEFIMPGNHQLEYAQTTSMCNAGHMNADSTGADDLALFRATMYGPEGDQYYDLQLCVFYGGANPDTIPDYVLTFPREEWTNDKCDVRGLGDINADGFDDLGYIMARPGYVGFNTFGIIYGGSMANTVLMEAGSPYDMVDMHGIGDVNADGIDDFTVGYMYFVNNDRYFRDVLYFGNESGNFSDSLVLCDGLNVRNPYSYPAGDLNWDGYADFVSSFTGSNAKLYFGGTGFNGNNYILITPPYNGTSMGEGFGHGDVNGNGTDDPMGTFTTQFNGYGDAYLWMGGVPMNGDTDLHLTPPGLSSDDEMFGFCLTMGDYNADGYCDAAISAPFNYGGGAGVPGRVFVYAGNQQLNDPTPIEDDTETPVISKMKLYPNPLQPLQSNLNVKFPLLTPLPPSSRGVISFEIYNIRGQKVKSFTMSAEQTKSGSASYNLNDLSTGVYLCTYTNGEQIQKGKITIMK